MKKNKSMINIIRKYAELYPLIRRISWRPGLGFWEDKSPHDESLPTRVFGELNLPWWTEAEGLGDFRLRPLRKTLCDKGTSDYTFH